MDLARKAQCEVQRSTAQATTIPFGTGLVLVIHPRYLVDTGGSAERVFRHSHQGLYLKPSIAPAAVSSFYIKASSLADFIYFYVSPSTSYNTLWPHSKEDLAGRPSMAKPLNPPLSQLQQTGKLGDTTKEEHQGGHRYTCWGNGIRLAGMADPRTPNLWKYIAAVTKQ